MTERIRFFFDPICPWCYQTSRWARRLAELGEVELEWGLFSLEMVNARGEDGDATQSDDGPPPRAGLALCTSVMVRDEHGATGLGSFYAELGRRVHEVAEPLEQRETVEAALRDAGLDPSLSARALADDSTWARVRQEHTELVDRTRSFGVPTIGLLDADGAVTSAIFGPVISEVPGDEDAVELFRHVAWLARYENFSELKRERTVRPDLESVRRSRQRREAESAKA